MNKKEAFYHFSYTQAYIYKSKRKWIHVLQERKKGRTCQNVCFQLA